LKRDYTGVTSAKLEDFRGRSAAASLKPSGQRQLPQRLCDFRGRSAAASLKPCVAMFALVRFALFPRSFGRGLIEARTFTALMDSWIQFPRSFGRGLIEAARARRSNSETAAFPRSFGRGLIEAAGSPGARQARAGFPRSFGRGLIEVNRNRPRPLRTFNFRGHSAAASLKLHLPPNLALPPQISAVIRPRPH